MTESLMEKCEHLEKMHKVVGLLLSFNVMKHSDEFVQGISNINEVKEDINCIK